MSGDPELLEYSFKAWERQPWRRSAALSGMLIAGASGLLLLHHPVFALLGALIVFVSTAELFLPVKYRLDKTEARQQVGFSVTAIKWTDVKRIVRVDDGVRLSPFDAPNRLDAFRGVFLRYASNEDDVWSTIRVLWHDNAVTVGRESESGPESGDGGESGAGDPQARSGDPSDPVS